MAPAVDSMLGAVLSNTYKITGKLGEGGMGSVYRAEHQRLPRPYAIKVLHQTVEPDSEFYHRFRREAEICSRLRHENIVEVMDFNFTPDGRPYIAMELLDGEDLESRLDRGGAMTEAETLAIVSQAAAGLGEAHAQGVVHRDLKPQNIFLCRRRQGGDLVKIVDFGISKIQGSVTMLTAAHSLVGTPYYMSPEQTGAGDGRVTSRSDIYALGVIAYQMLSGELPIVGESLAKIVMSINTLRPRPLRELVPHLSPAVEAVIDVALAKDPLRRFASAADFHEALRRAVEIGDLTGISPHDSVAETLHAGDEEPVQSAGRAATDDLVHTSGYDQRAFHASPQRQDSGLVPEPITVREGPTRAEVGAAEPVAGPSAAPPGSASQPAGSTGVSKTTLSSATGESPVTSALPRRAASWGKVMVAVGVVVLVLGAGAIWYDLDRSRQTGTKGGADTPDPSTPKVTMEPAAEPAHRVIPLPMVRHPPGDARVVIRLKGLPVGARCTLDGKAVEGNPLVLPRASRSLRLTCRAKGYRTSSTEVIPDRDQTVPAELKPGPRGMYRYRPRRPGMRTMRRARPPVMRRRARPIDSDIPIE